MARVPLIALLALSLAALGCGGNKNRYLRKQAGHDLGCSESQVHLSTVSRSDAQYLAEACGRRAVYSYTREGRAQRISAIEGANVPGQPVVMPPPNSGEYLGPTPPPPPPPPSSP